MLTGKSDRFSSYLIAYRDGQAAAMRAVSAAGDTRHAGILALAVIASAAASVPDNDVNMQVGIRHHACLTGGHKAGES